MQTIQRILALLVLSSAITGIATAQAQNPVQGSPNAKPAAPTVAPQSTLPFPAQLKKTVVFIQADCEPSATELAELPPDDLAKWYLHQTAQMKPTSLAKVEHPHSGTGFLIQFADDRIPKDARFMYLVTNRHVAQPGIEKGQPCNVFDYNILSNSTEVIPGTNSILQTTHTGSTLRWSYPRDESVDLAIAPITLSSSIDYLSLSLDLFVTDEMIAQHQVVEGDPVIFAGLFIWFHGSRRLEPIVRSGTLAMLPSEAVQTTLGKLGQVYFARYIQLWRQQRVADSS